MFCPKCGSEIDEGVVFCPACGTDVSQGKKTTEDVGINNGSSRTSNGTGSVTLCPKCHGNNISFQRESSGVQGFHKTTALCKNCGYTWTTANDLHGAQPYGTSAKSKGTALVLCIFLGYFGAHYFYVGKVGMGILYLFTAGLCGIGWLIDIFRILCGGFRDSNGIPLK